jgi:hypothetical protein
LNNEIIIRSLVQHGIDNASTNIGLEFDGSDLTKFAKTVIDVYASSGFSIHSSQVENLVSIIQNLSNSQFQLTNFTEIAGQLEGSDFVAVDFGVLGVFKPSTAAGSLYFDYVEMIKTDGVKFFDDLHYSICDSLRLAKESGKSFSENDVKEIIPLDYSQKKAARLAINHSIVVQGPPGTGKSQTISNMIANFISLCRSVLFVTEKKTAAGVVYNRLNRLRAFCLKFYEIDSDTLEFTRQVRLGLNRIRELYGVSAVNNGEQKIVLNVASIRLDEIFEKLEKFKDAMKNEDGKKFPQFVIKYIDNRETINEGLKFVKSLTNTFNTAKDF